MDAPMTPREAVAWLIEGTAAARRVGCHANCERYKADCAQDAKRRAYEKQFAYLDSMPQTATALKKTLAPRRVGGQQ